MNKDTGVSLDKELEVFRQADWVEPENRFVFWSGGKDSTVALHLALRAWRGSNPLTKSDAESTPAVVFIDTGITVPEPRLDATRQFIHNIEKFTEVRVKTLRKAWYEK